MPCTDHVLLHLVAINPVHVCRFFTYMKILHNMRYYFPYSYICTNDILQQIFEHLLCANYSFKYREKSSDRNKIPALFISGVGRQAINKT